MKNLNLAPVLKYRFQDTLKAMSIFVGIMILILFATYILIAVAVNNGSNSSGSFSAFGIAATITLFVTGIATVRDDFRLMIQNGISRRTVFTAELLVTMIISLLLAIAGEIIITIGQLIISKQPYFFISDIYQLLFTDFELATKMSMTDHIKSIILLFFLFTCTNIIGMFISMLFYRLNKVWTLIVAIGTPIFIFVILPIVLSWKNINILPFFNFITKTPWHLCSFFIITAAAFAAIIWLISKRAPIKPIK